MSDRDWWSDWRDHFMALVRRHPQESKEASVLAAVDHCLALLRSAAPDLPPPQSGPGEAGLAESMELAWTRDGARLDLDVSQWACEYTYREGGELLRSGLWSHDRPIWPELAWAARRVAGGEV